VLDTVDPEKLKRAPIQGFIKKPIELRELAERVQQLLATPVTLAEPEGIQEEPTVLSPFATVPGTKFTNLPEFRGVVDGPPSEEIQPTEHAGFDGPNDQDDLLMLTPEDFWFEEAPVEPGSPDFLLAQATAEAMAEAEFEPPPPLMMATVDSTLDLEELDLEALKDLPNEEPPTLPEVPDVPEVSFAQQSEEHPGDAFVETPEGPATHEEPIPTAEGAVAVGELLGEDTLAIPGLAVRARALSVQEPSAVDFPAHEFLTEDISAHTLSDLGEVPDFEDLTPETPPAESHAPPMFEEAAPHTEPNEEPVFPSAAAYALPAAGPALSVVSAWHDAAGAPVPPAPVAPAPVGASGEEAPRDVAALVQVIMSDPALMDALAKAVVARLGDQALREIAWELMPELAEKLPR